MEPPVEPDRGTDQREVCEGLREVAEQLAARADLLRVQPEVVCVSIFSNASPPSTGRQLAVTPVAKLLGEPWMRRSPTELGSGFGRDGSLIEQ